MTAWQEGRWQFLAFFSNWTEMRRKGTARQLTGVLYQSWCRGKEAQYWTNGSWDRHLHCQANLYLPPPSISSCLRLPIVHKLCLSHFSINLQRFNSLHKATVCMFTPKNKWSASLCLPVSLFLPPALFLISPSSSPSRSLLSAMVCCHPWKLGFTELGRTFPGERLYVSQIKRVEVCGKQRALCRYCN